MTERNPLSRFQLNAEVYQQIDTCLQQMLNAHRGLSSAQSLVVLEASLGLLGRFVTLARDQAEIDRAEQFVLPGEPLMITPRPRTTTD